MSRTHDITISGFDLDRLEAELAAAERVAAEQTKRANENHAWALRAERERDAERALAEALREVCETLLADKPRDITELLNKAGAVLAAWKEARND